VNEKGFKVQLMVYLCDISTKTLTYKNNDQSNVSVKSNLTSFILNHTRVNYISSLNDGQRRGFV